MTNPYEPTPPGPATEAQQKLESLPSLDTTKAQVQAAVEEITSAATGLIPAMTWEKQGNGETGNCERPYDQSDGQRSFLPKYVSDMPVPEENWQQIYELVKRVAATLGATESQVYQDRPGKHDVRFYNDTGTAIQVATQKATLIAGYTGCRLPAPKK